ncbi:ribosome recycling factor [Granulosicoccus antarcticus]|uniref:Ribosome-recycling factor n=1 Tax=Granulosicoccus antarcticus IMCC3135 TaxID=1192854 RepID=A0A2Z2NXH8_9GAMM|nr:ribosome recycling factor [Granulosicoccus antarcticus]ASJ75165.1 Ribosome-recycling factor [Granulosicoccus antarcticus IMCC3135]
MIDDILKDAKIRMGKTADSLESELSRMRTGRAHPSLLESVKVDYYGAESPLSQVANVNIEDARMLTVTPWEQSMVAAVEKAIINSNLGLNPNTAGTVIRVPVPPMTEERRRDMVKMVRAETENTRVAIRNIRRDANGDLKELEKEKEISQDDLRKGEDGVQKLTDAAIKNIDAVLAKKEADLMEV